MDNMRDNSFTYEIAGHFFEMVWELPDGQHWQLPGFAPFLTNNMTSKLSNKLSGTEMTEIAPQIQNFNEGKLLTINILSIEEADQSAHERAEAAAQDRTLKNAERKISTFDIENGTCELSKLDNSYKFQVFTMEGKLSIRLEMEKGRSAMNCYCALYENPASPRKAPDPNHLRFAMWMAVGFAGIPERTAAIHASVIIHENQAVLFLGESGTGKSTHTRLWLDNIPGTRLLNDDSPILRLHKQTNTLYIYGSPWSGKGKVYRNERYPVAAIVRLQQAPFNRATPLNVVHGFAALYPSFPPAYLKDEDLHEHICTIISEILKTTLVFRLACLPTPSAALHIYRKIFTDEGPSHGDAKKSHTGTRKNRKAKNRNCL
jgi:hypothetical protein